LYSVYSAVGINDAANEAWSTAQLSVARAYFTATSLPDQGLALFAGGCNHDISIGVRILFVWAPFCC
jgi:hypothetical protein